MKKILKQLQKGAFGEHPEYASLDKTCKNTEKTLAKYSTEEKKSSDALTAATVKQDESESETIYRLRKEFKKSRLRRKIAQIDDALSQRAIKIWGKNFGKENHQELKQRTSEATSPMPLKKPRMAVAKVNV